jgi:hypothetical protein
MSDEFEDIDKVFLFISSVSTKCVAPEKYARTRPREFSGRFPITVVRLDTKEIRQQFYNHPIHPIKCVPSLAVVYIDGRVDVHTSPVRVMRFMQKYDRYIYEYLHAEYENSRREIITDDPQTVPQNDMDEPEIIDDDPIEDVPPPPPPVKQVKKREQPQPQPPKMLQSEVADLVKHPKSMEILEDESSMQIIDDDIPEVPPMQHAKGLQIDNNVKRNQSMSSLIEKARKMEAESKKTMPGLDEKRYPSYN